MPSRYGAADMELQKLGSDAQTSSRKSQKKPSKLKLIAVVVILCLAFFGCGYVGGYFTPRTTTPTPVSATTSQPIVQKSWRDGPCPIITGSQCPAGYIKSPPLLLVSFDGFTSEYLSRDGIPAFKRIQECGVHAPSMRPSHPPITFPNHYSIATGLHSESHGIIDNIFYDQGSKKQFYYRDPSAMESDWWKGEPIWVTAKKQGKKAHAYFFVGSEAEIQGVRPDVWVPFNQSHTFDNRVDAVLAWLSLPDDSRPDISTLYFEEPDSRGHNFGTHSNEVTEALTGRVNSALDRLMQGLYDRNILDCVNIIILSDHGMANMTCDDSIFVQPNIIEHSALAGRLKETDYNLSGGVMGRMSLNESVGTVVTDEDLFQALQCKEPKPYQVYRKRDFPRRLHFTHPTRVEPIIININEGHNIYKSPGTHWCLGGTHGYDNIYPSMQTIFLAQGPSLRSGLTVAPFQNIELYNVMCDLLNIKPAANNGTYGSLHHILRFDGQLPDIIPGVVEQQEFPATEQEVKRRQDCWETCPGIEHASDMSLKTTSGEQKRRLALSAPYGVPASLNSTIILANLDYALGYQKPLKLASWISFSTSEKIELNTLSFDATCSRNDVRFDPLETLICRDFQNPAATLILRPIYLFPLGLASTVLPVDDTRLITNTVPMYGSFRDGVWLEFWKILALWSADWKLNVISGPVFDSAFPYGVVDFPEEHKFSPDFPKLLVPSHYFVVVTRDNRKPSCVADNCLPEVMAFILPHEATPRSPCQDIESYFLTHSATVRDVELVTGLRFFNDLPQYEAIRLRVQLPTKLWPKTHGL